VVLIPSYFIVKIIIIAFLLLWMTEIEKSGESQTLQGSSSGPDMRNFRVNHLHRLRCFVAVPVLPGTVNDAANPALENKSGPGVGGKTQPAALLS